jgi:hypothetical protein
MDFQPVNHLMSNGLERLKAARGLITKLLEDVKHPSYGIEVKFLETDFISNEIGARLACD